MQIKLINPFLKDQNLVLDKNGLKAITGSKIFPYVNGAYRNLQTDKNYTSNFGYQWNLAKKSLK